MKLLKRVLIALLALVVLVVLAFFLWTVPVPVEPS